MGRGNILSLICDICLTLGSLPIAPTFFVFYIYTLCCYNRQHYNSNNHDQNRPIVIKHRRPTLR